jgi:hypothetical protein
MIFSLRETCLAYIILFDIVTHTIFNNLVARINHVRPSVCRLLNTLFLPLLVVQIILLSALFSKIRKLWFFLDWRLDIKFGALVKQREKWYFSLYVFKQETEGKDSGLRL